MAAHSSILAWKIPWTEQHCGLQSTGPQRVRQQSNQTHTHTHTRRDTHTTLAVQVKLTTVYVSEITVSELCRPSCVHSGWIYNACLYEVDGKGGVLSPSQGQEPDGAVPEATLCGGCDYLHFKRQLGKVKYMLQTRVRPGGTWASDSKVSFHRTTLVTANPDLGGGWGGELNKQA